jgi:hypothetical protein
MSSIRRDGGDEGASEDASGPKPPREQTQFPYRSRCASHALIPSRAGEFCDMTFLCTLMDDPVVAADGHTSGTLPLPAPLAIIMCIHV